MTIPPFDGGEVAAALNLAVAQRACCPLGCVRFDRDCPGQPAGVSLLASDQAWRFAQVVMTACITIVEALKPPQWAVSCRHPQQCDGSCAQVAAARQMVDSIVAQLRKQQDAL